MPILENLRKALGLDNDMPDDHDMELPWEEDFSPLGGRVPDTGTLNMPRLVDALRRLYSALDAETRKAVSDGELPVTAPAPVAAVETVGGEVSSAEYARLEEQKREAENKVRALQNRVNELERQLSEATKAKRVEPVPKQVSQAKAEEEVKRLQTLNQQLTTKSKISDRMLSDIQKAFADKRKEAEALAAENDQLKRQMQPDQLAAAQRRIQELEDANSNLRQERKELKETIESNLYNQALNENQLRQRIKQLEGSKPRRRGKSKDEKGREENPRRDKSNLDKALDATNWIDGAPDKPADDDFGYQEPKKTTAPDPDEQLFLF